MRNVYFFQIVLWLILASKAFGQQAYPEGLQRGEKAPEFTETDIEGRTVSLKELLKKGPVILIFYRDAVCPYGKKEIFDLQDKMLQMAKAGRTVVAIGPDIEIAKQSFARAGITNEVPFIEDKNYNIHTKYKVTYRLDELTKSMYERKGYKLNKTDADGNYSLSMPSIFIVGTDGRIKYANCNTDSNPDQMFSFIEKILNEI
ncbi:MAG: redoxin domain-containing protein [Bacteroidia bacterium]|nr:redoxin domain-containing protein [Bacteroidia bacterium]MDW8302495.1 redoxin domain-containing protein [Bacteroidia bacterium]